jgi:hypothetical protein
MVSDSQKFPDTVPLKNEGVFAGVNTSQFFADNNNNDDDYCRCRLHRRIAYLRCQHKSSEYLREFS